MSVLDGDKKATTKGQDVTQMSEEEENRWGKYVIEDKRRIVITLVDTILSQRHFKV